MMKVLSIKGLEAWYGRTKVLHGLDVHLDEGGFTAVLGANGAGKTTLLRAISGLVTVKGDIEFAGKSLVGVAPEDIVRRGIAHVPVGRGTFLALTVEENLRAGAYLLRNKADIAAAIERAYSYFPRLRERRMQQAGTLSGGEQQMLAISRGIVSRPRLLLLDEPSVGLAPLIVEEIFEIMKQIRTVDGVSILVVEQNATLALKVADHAFVMETGRLVLSGTAAEIANDDGIRRSYLGY
ncbi:MAG: ABC transporter ATP-binding protein [Hyphomicrobiales bacterium]|nr:MAG: ABC transporter ATP-binding protein [Hyphomicrobiales bacterium]